MVPAPLSLILAEQTVQNNLSPQAAAELFQKINSSSSVSGNANQSQSSSSSSANIGVVVAAVIAVSVLAVCLIAAFAQSGNQNSIAEAQPIR